MADPKRLWCRESTGIIVPITVKDQASGDPVDIAGWTFACSFSRQIGSNDVTLGMAATATALGFFILDAAGGSYQMCVTAAALEAIADTTGDFTMFGDIIATLPGGQRQWMDDLLLEVTKGPTA